MLEIDPIQLPEHWIPMYQPLRRLRVICLAAGDEKADEELCSRATGFGQNRTLIPPAERMDQVQQEERSLWTGSR